MREFSFFFPKQKLELSFFRLVEYLCLPDDGAYHLKIQAATILGSIAYGKEKKKTFVVGTKWNYAFFFCFKKGKDENVSAVVASGAIVPLLNTLALPRDKPVMEAIKERRKLLEAATRALKAIFASSRSIKNDTFTVSDFVVVRFFFFCLFVTLFFYMSNVEKTYSGFSFIIGRYI